jgi:hypothetical protein
LSDPALKDVRQFAKLLFGTHDRQPALRHQANKGDPAAEHSEVAPTFGHLEAEFLEEVGVRSTNDSLVDAGEACFDQTQRIDPRHNGVGSFVRRPHPNLAVGSAFRLKRDRSRLLWLTKCRQLSLRQIPRMLPKLRVVEIEEPQGLFALEHPSTLAVERHQRCCRIEQTAEVGTDPRPSTVDPTVEAGAGKDLTRTETVSGLEDDALIIPGRRQHRSEPSLGQFELRELALELDGWQRSEHWQSARKIRRREEDEPGISRGECNPYLDVVALQPRDRGAGFLQRQLQFECGPQILAGEVAEVDPFGRRSAGRYEWMSRVGAPHRTGPEALHRSPDVQPLQECRGGMKTRHVPLSAGRARAGREGALADVRYANRGGRRDELGFEIFSRPRDFRHAAVLVEVVAALRDSTRQLAEHFAGVDFKKP